MSPRIVCEGSWKSRRSWRLGRRRCVFVGGETNGFPRLVNDKHTQLFFCPGTTKYQKFREGVYNVVGEECWWGPTSVPSIVVREHSTRTDSLSYSQPGRYPVLGTGLRVTTHDTLVTRVRRTTFTYTPRRDRSPGVEQYLPRVVRQEK